jgi:hypothetical protein
MMNLNPKNDAKTVPLERRKMPAGIAKHRGFIDPSDEAIFREPRSPLREKNASIQFIGL